MTPLCSRSIEDTSDLDIPKPLVDRLREAERFSDPEFEMTTKSRALPLPRTGARAGLAAWFQRLASPALHLRRAPARGARLPALRSERSRWSRAASFVGGTLQVMACGFAFASAMYLVLILGLGLAR